MKNGQYKVTCFYNEGDQVDLDTLIEESFILYVKSELGKKN